MSSPVFSRNSSPARWFEEPTPEEAKVMPFGSAFTLAISSWMVRTPRALLAATTFGTSTSIATAGSACRTS